MDDLSIGERLVKVETKQEGLEMLVNALQDDIRATRVMVKNLEDKIDNKFDSLQGVIQETMQTSAANVPPKFAWNMSIILGVCGICFGAASIVVAGLILHW